MTVQDATVMSTPSLPVDLGRGRAPNRIRPVAGRATRWVFTLNNPTDVELSGVRAAVGPVYSFICFGHELAPGTGTPHLQGYLETVARVRVTAFKDGPLRRAHFEVARGSTEECIQYCKKDGEFESFGTARPPSSGGERQHAAWEEVLASARTGQLDDVPASYLVRYHSTLLRIAAEARWAVAASRVVPPAIQLRRWQIELQRVISGPPEPRRISFVVDLDGGGGKSTFARYLCALPGSDILRLHPGRGVDLAHLLSRPFQTFIVDCPRGSQEYMPWSFLESLKDGYVVSTKYEGGFKEFPTPHVFVFTNTPVPQHVLSEDRVIEYYVSAKNEDFEKIVDHNDPLFEYPDTAREVGPMDLRSTVFSPSLWKKK